MEMSEKELKKLQNAADITNIQMLMAKYVEYIAGMEPMRAFTELFAAEHEEVYVEIDECGGYIGKKASAFMERYDAYLKDPSDKRGWMDMQNLTTPYVIVGQDGSRARGQWSVFNPQAKMATAYPDCVHRLTAIWCFSKYTAEFIRQENQWKILKLRLLSYVRAPLEQGWNIQPDCYRMPAELYLAPDTPPRTSIYNTDCIYSGHGIYNWGPYLPDTAF